MKKITLLVSVFVAMVFHGNAQNVYKYSVNLNQVTNDQLKVTLVTPKVTTASTTFYMPKIVPGTYRYSDYGKFVHNLKAFDKAGKALPVTQTSDNSWKIGKANTMVKITYNVEDTWDASFKNDVYSMAGTNFEAGKNFVLNTCGIFGYLDTKKNIPFELNISKPAGFYGSTGLVPTKTSSTADSYRCANADHLYDSPIMFCKPDTTTVKVGSTSVLVSVYSPNKLATSKFIAENLERVLMATNKYLGGKLPVDKYAFIYYFNGEQAPFETSGAWEHSYSSFYSLAEEPQDEAISSWVDMSAHEFFHIVTPLTISSREVKQFDFNQPKLSKHLWLYEGSTEYDAHHMQVQNGIKSVDDYLRTLQGEITYSRQAMNDSLSFTEMSKESAGKWKEQYNNVYMKGALISASLDLYLLHLSKGKYGLANLKHDLGVKYGKDKYFNDDELFDEIAKMTYPEVRTFFSKYVEGGTPIPYEQFFDYAGVKFTRVSYVNVATMGGILMGGSPDGAIYVRGTDNMNDFGKAVGFKTGDIIESVNGTRVSTANINAFAASFNEQTKEGSNVEIVLLRKNSNGTNDRLVVNKPAVIVKKAVANTLELLPNPTPEQLAIRKIWLGQ